MTLNQAKEIFSLPFMELLERAHSVHKQHFNQNQIQVSALLSIKTGGCLEDCAYCAQSASNSSGTKAEKLSKEQILEAVKKAKQEGSTRFCMGASGRAPSDSEVQSVCDIVREIKKLGLETCLTMGFLSAEQAARLKEAGLDYYNHNVDTSREFYANIITTREFEARLETIKTAQDAGLKVCVGGIVGMGESREDRISMLVSLSNMRPQPDSVPINKLIPIAGTPLENGAPMDGIEIVRTIALARILMPASHVRLAAGRASMSEELQSLCFFAGANSIFYGERLLSADNAAPSKDDILFSKLGLERELIIESAGEVV